MKSLVFTCSLASMALGLLGCGGSSSAAGSSAEESVRASSDRGDLAVDLAKPGGPHGSPFVKADARPLAPERWSSFRPILERCLEDHFYTDDQGEVIDVGIRSSCVELPPTSYDGAKMTERADVQATASSLTAVTWDAADSYYGDTRDVAFYDDDGTRLAVYPEVVFFGFPNDDLSLFGYIAGLAGVTPRKIEDPH
jgi:hypothetical protein